MKNPRFRNRIGKACALVGATLVLPVLTYAQNQSGQGQNYNRPPVVPEVNTAWVLVPILGGVLLYSWRRFSRPNS